MKIRSKSELFDYLDNDISWRKKEIINIANTIKNDRHEHTRYIFLRAGILLVYAHWEGFIKNASIAYITYIQHLGHDINNLSINFKAMYAQKEIISKQDKSSFLKAYEVLSLANNSGNKLPNDTGDIIKTYSNLTYEIFEEIAQKLNIDTSRFHLLKNLINELLLGKRNKIAHGERHDIRSDDFNDIYTKIIDALDGFKTEIMNSVSSTRYRQ